MRFRTDWFREMSDPEFRLRFCFTKENTRRLIDLVRGSLEKPDKKGSPLTPEQIVLTGETKLFIEICLKNVASRYSMLIFFNYRWNSTFIYAQDWIFLGVLTTRGLRDTSRGVALPLHMKHCMGCI